MAQLKIKLTKLQLVPSSGIPLAPKVLALSCLQIGLMWSVFARECLDSKAAWVVTE
jgi:hypothetical protein